MERWNHMRVLNATGRGLIAGMYIPPGMLFALLWACAGVSAAAPATPRPETQETFFARGLAAVERNAAVQPDRRRAKNVILFLGDGMGVATVTAARILDGQQKGMLGEENELSFEKFPYLAHSKTYQANQQVPDSAPTMTAIVTGSKTNDGFLSVSPAVTGLDFVAAGRPENRLRTILEQAEEKGLWTGVVSTARLTHATPAACYAHTPARGAEDDTDLAEISRSAAESGYPDIARQLLELRIRPTTMNGHPSPGLEVALGGGRSKFLRVTDPDPEYAGQKGTRNDRNLAQAWAARGGAYVWNGPAFRAIDPASTGPVLGLFEPSHMQYEWDRARDPAGEPSLTAMTEKAIRILSRSPNGYFLMVEAGRIDHAHHEGNAFRALTEAVELSRAVEKAVQIAGEDTLILVTADHSHTLFIAGYPVRGNPILGLVVTNGEDGRPEKTPTRDTLDRLPYTTLNYGTGPGAVAGPRKDLSGVDTAAPDFRQQAAIPMSSEAHAGEDVAIYARGPHAYLVGGTMEQNAIYFVMARALGLPLP
jgi:alkaline phosphatase